MTNAEFNEMAALVVRLRKDLELHTDALRQSNAQCSKLLVQNEQLTAELDRTRYDNARALCFTTHDENDRQMGIFIAAMKTTQAKRIAFDRAISEGVRQSMQPKQCGATMLCMRGAR